MDTLSIDDEDIKNYVEIIKRTGELTTENIASAFLLARDSLIAYDRISEIKFNYKKAYTGRGEKAQEKKRLDEMCEALLKVHSIAKEVYKIQSDVMRKKRYEE